MSTRDTQERVVDSRQPSSCRAIANYQEISSIRSRVRRLVIGRQSTGDMDAGFLAVNSISDHEHLCALEVHGLADTLARDQEDVHKEFCK